MYANIKKLFEGKRKFIAIPAIPITAILAWPFVIPGLLRLLVHKKVNSPRWKYGLFALIAMVGIGSAPAYYANLNHPYIAQPETVEHRTIDGQVKAAIAPSDIPTPMPTITPTETPSPTVTPIRIPTPTIAYVPQKVYSSSTSTQTKKLNTQSTTQDNSSDGNSVHSPAYSIDNSVPAGATAKCGDGTYSFSQSRRGTCSHHDGVVQWL